MWGAETMNFPSSNLPLFPPHLLHRTKILYPAVLSLCVFLASSVLQFPLLVQCGVPTILFGSDHTCASPNRTGVQLGSLSHRSTVVGESELISRLDFKNWFIKLCIFLQLGNFITLIVHVCGPGLIVDFSKIYFESL